MPPRPLRGQRPRSRPPLPRPGRLKPLVPSFDRDAVGGYRASNTCRARQCHFSRPIRVSSAERCTPRSSPRSSGREPEVDDARGERSGLQQPKAGRTLEVRGRTACPAEDQRMDDELVLVHEAASLDRDPDRYGIRALNSIFGRSSSADAGSQHRDPERRSRYGSRLIPDAWSIAVCSSSRVASGPGTSSRSDTARVTSRPAMLRPRSSTR